MIAMKWWLLFSIALPLVVLAIPGDPDLQAYCADLAREGDCNFYNYCIEKWTQTCGDSGYALGYGAKYCRRFDENQHLFNEEGQEWIDSVRLCLLDELLHSSVYAENGTCGEISSFAYSTHPSCYVDNGFCTVILMDRQNLNATFVTVDTIDLLWPPEAARATYDTLKLCFMSNNYNNTQVTKSSFSTWITHLTADYPVLSKLVRDLSQ